MAIVHCWSQYEPADRDTRRRHAVAQASWRDQPWRDLPIADASLPRLFTCGTKRLPYVKDLLDRACVALSDTDIVVFTNADIGVAPDCAIRIVAALQLNDATYAFRNDFAYVIAEPLSSERIRDGVQYAGSDLFAFRAGWWRSYRKLYPDALLGAEAWDACLRVLIEATNDAKPLSLPHLIYHERHGGVQYWEHPANRYTLASQRHNLKLARLFLASCGHNPASFGIR